MTHVQSMPLPQFKKSALAGKIALLVLSVAAIATPLVAVRTMGVTRSVSLIDPNLLGMVAFLVPAMFVLALAALFVEQLRPHARLIDMAGFAVALAVALYALNFVLTGFSELRQADQQMAQLLGSNQGFSASKLVRISPSFGLLPGVMLLALSGVYAVRAFLARKA